MSRKTLQDDEKNAVCVRYAQTGSLRAVASEYGISPMRVKRLWEALGEQQQQVLRASVEDLRQEVETTIVRSELTGDYLERVIKARLLPNYGRVCRTRSCAGPCPIKI